MKSLEIVNDLIWKTQRKYDYVDLKKDKNQIEKELEEINSEFSKLNQIQQDLEVLEILRKHLEIIEYLGMKNIETYGLTTIKNKEDFNKLKQWLEENEE